MWIKSSAWLREDYAAHDFNDFEVGKRHNLEQVNIMTKTAHLNDNVPEKYRGMDRYEARKAVIEDLKAQGLLVGIKPHKHMVPLVPRTVKWLSR